MQYNITKDFIKERPLNVGLSVLVFVTNKGQNKGQRSVHEQGKAELCRFYLISDIKNILNSRRNSGSKRF